MFRLKPRRTRQDRGNRSNPGLHYFSLDDIPGYVLPLLKSEKHTVHRCTDVRDRRGQLIYENDMVIVDDKHIFPKLMGLDLYSVGKVAFKNGTFWFRPRPSGSLPPIPLNHFLATDDCALLIQHKRR